jgi:NAD(P)-dependent dehydrogenase (short-subunit alcohol dehydrogenase family)
MTAADAGELGGIDVLVNGAGIYPTRPRPNHHETEGTWTES